MAEHFDVCIVGSGFGGSICAYHLARAGKRVVILERGERWRDEDLQVELDPKRLLRITHQFLGTGASVLVGHGVGGGSLVYSGASLRAPSFVFDRRESGRRIWPRALSRAALDPWYRRVERGLGVHQLGWEEVARRGSGWAKRMNRLGYRVDPMRQAVTRCLHCGFCNTGCRFQRKNHLPFNYLRGAEAAGAEIRPSREAVAIQSAGSAYRVLHGPTDRSSVARPRAPSLAAAEEIHAEEVVVAGGAIGSAGLLLRSRPWLPRLSAHLGRHLSANGDYALAAVLPPDRTLPGRGRMQHHRGVAMDTVCFEWLESHGFIVITQHQLAPATLVNGDTRGRWWGLEKKKLMEEYGDSLVGLAVIGVDGSPGRVETVADPSDEVGVTPAFGVANLDFPPDRETRRLFHDAREIVGGVVARMGGTLLDVDLNLHPGYESMAFSAHPLGTARMADDPADGVVDGHGRVHGYPGLNVIDGSIVPTALGVNPSLTIAAVAERAAHAMVRRLGGRPSEPPVANPHVRPRRNERRRPGKGVRA